MTCYRLPMVVAVVFALTTICLAEEKSDKELIQGTWRVTSDVQQGNPDRRRVGDEFIFSGDTVTHKFWDAKDPPMAATYVLDATKTPKTIDVKMTGGGPAILGLYQLNGDNLSLCFHMDESRSGERPAEFSSTPGSGRAMMTLERVKK